MRIPAAVRPAINARPIAEPAMIAAASRMAVRTRITGLGSYGGWPGDGRAADDQDRRGSEASASAVPAPGATQAVAAQDGSVPSLLRVPGPVHGRRGRGTGRPVRLAGARRARMWPSARPGTAR